MAREKENISYIILQISIRVLVNVVLVFVLVQGFVSAYNFSYKLFTDIPYKVTSTQVQEITIESGSSIVDIAALLEEKEVVENKYLFIARGYVGEYKAYIKAGTYTLSPSMSPDTICKIICGMQSEETS